MCREQNPTMNRTSKHRTQNHLGASRENCLLCRVVWPAILQHRHLLFDNSSEANTLFITTKEKP